MKSKQVTYLHRIHIWGKMVSLGMLLYGITSIVTSFFTSYLYIIPGLVTLLFGKMLLDVAQEAKRALQSEEGSIRIAQGLFHAYSSILFFFGILLMITILLYLTFFLMITML